MNSKDEYSIVLIYEGRLGSSRADSTFVLENALYFSKTHHTTIWNSKRINWQIPETIRKDFKIVSFGRAFDPKTLFSSIYHQLMFGFQIRNELRVRSKSQKDRFVIIFHDWWPLIPLITFRHKGRSILVLEVHRSLPKNLIQLGFFSHIHLFIATNKFKFFELRKYVKGKIIYEPNCVGLSAYERTKQISALPKLNRRSVLYTGSLGREKNPNMLLNISAELPEMDFYVVGVIPDAWKDLNIPPNLILLGPKLHSEIASYQLSADLLLVTLDPKDTQSSLYTSTMKLFEYIAARRPIIAPDLPSVLEVLSPDEFYSYQADEIDSLRRALKLASRNLKKPKLPREETITKISWEDRNRRIISEINQIAQTQTH